MGRTTKLIENMVRQGDVLLVPADGESTTPCVPPASDGSTVLAHGKATGYRHRYAADDAVELREAPERRTRHLTIGQARGLLHEEHTEIPAVPGVYDLPQQVEYAPEELRRVAD